MDPTVLPIATAISVFTHAHVATAVDDVAIAVDVSALAVAVSSMIEQLVRVGYAQHGRGYLAYLRHANPDLPPLVQYVTRTNTDIHAGAEHAALIAAVAQYDPATTFVVLEGDDTTGTACVTKVQIAIVHFSTRHAEQYKDAA